MAKPKPVCITADSTCDLPKELLKRFDIRIIPLTIIYGEESWKDGVDITRDDMYRHYRAGRLLPQTSAPSVQEFLDFFTPIVEAGYEIVHLDISSELSNSYNAARLAAAELGGVYVVDSRHLCCGLGLLAIEGAECRDGGLPAKIIAEHLRALIGKVETSFVLDTLEFMQKGGRCSNLAVLGANLLRLKPALEMSDGKLVVYKKYRGSIEQAAKQYIRERLAGKKIRTGHIIVADSGDIDKALLKEIYELIRAAVPVKELHHADAGCTICAHCGPRTVAVFFINE